MFPAARMGDTTMTGDAITGPCAPTVLIAGAFASVVGDSVNGSACVGSIATGSATVFINNRPAARVSSVVNGANPATGVPVSTTIASGAPNVLIGG